MFKELGLPNFTANAFLYMGDSHYRSGDPAAGLNTPPPREVWEAMFEQARLAQEIRSIVDAPVFVLSAYRSPEYNAALPNAGRRSQHLFGRATDIRSTAGEPALFAAAMRLRRLGKFSGGIGRYDWGIHFDHRGRDANWDFRSPKKKRARKKTAKKAARKKIARKKIAKKKKGGER